MKTKFFFIITFGIITISHSTYGMKELVDALNKNNVETFNAALYRSLNDLYIYDAEGNTILHHACMKENITPYVVQLILDYEAINFWEHKPLYDHENNEGYTPFTCAVLCLQPLCNLCSIVESMQLTGFDPNHKNKDGNTVLHLFLQRYQENLWLHNEHQMLIFLKKIGCTLRIKNNEGKTPLQMIRDPQAAQTIQELWKLKTKRQPTLAEYLPESKKGVLNLFLDCCLI